MCAFFIIFFGACEQDHVEGLFRLRRAVTAVTVDALNEQERLRHWSQADGLRSYLTENVFSI